MKHTAIILVALVVPSTCAAATLNVPNQYPTIQAAIDAALDGDTVVVEKGTYVENINFLGKAITVKSVDGPEATVIDGGCPSDPDFGSVVHFNHNEGLDSVIRGFTLTNGKGTRTAWNRLDGGGIYTDKTSPIILDNIIINNEATFGGGISVYSGAPEIRNNRILQNEANSGGGGGGIDLNSCTAEVIGNIIQGNRAVGWQSTGGGINSGIYQNPQIKYNLILENNADNGGGIYCSSCNSTIEGNTLSMNEANEIGGGIYCDGWEGVPAIRYNTFHKNASKMEGGALYLWFAESPEIMGNVFEGNASSFIGGAVFSRGCNSVSMTNNLFYLNSADSGGALCCTNSSFDVTNNTFFKNAAKDWGGAVYSHNSYVFKMANTIFWNNNATNGKEICIDQKTASISYSDVEGGPASVCLRSGASINWGAGMIDADPMFVSPGTGDLHLRYDSPCRDAGDGGSAPKDDFEMDPRIDAAPDMGADEFYTHLYFTGPPVPGGTVEIKMIGDPASSPVGLCFGFHLMHPPLQSPYGPWYLLLPFAGPVYFPPMPSSGFQSFSGTIPSTPPGPYTVYLQAVIGAKATNLCALKVE